MKEINFSSLLEPTQILIAYNQSIVKRTRGFLALRLDGCFSET